MAMTPPFDPDELASAYLDGEVTPRESALVESDPALRQRVEELRRAAAAMAGTTPPPAESEDRLVERAMIVGTAPQVASLESRARNRRWVLAGLSAAAAIGILGLAVNVLFDEGNPQTDQLATGEAEEDLFTGGAAPADLGEIDDDAELRSEVAAATGLGESEAADFDAEAPAAAPQEAESDDEAPEADAPDAPAGGQEGDEGIVPPATVESGPISQECEIELVSREGDEIAGQLFQATATYRGEDAIVYLYARPDDSPIVFVVAQDGCDELTSFPLE